MTIKLANTPQYCAGCFNQQPSLRHVDFDSALDRGYGKDEAVKVAMDDAIFCENCIKEAARLLGMIEGDVWERSHADLTRKLEVQRKLREQAQRYADTLEDAVSAKGARVDHRKKPRQLREEAPVG